MLNTKLIFVEGIPGSGKTNTAEFLCSQLERNGIPVAHVHEKDPNHPTRMEWQGEASRIEGSLERWRDFASSRAQSDSVTVLDGQLFHRNTAELFFNDVELVTIANYVRGVIDAVSQLNPKTGSKLYQGISALTAIQSWRRWRGFIGSSLLRVAC